MSDACTTRARQFLRTLALSLLLLGPLVQAGPVDPIFEDGFQRSVPTIAYPQPAYTFELGQPITDLEPLLFGQPDTFTIDPDLPTGLSLDGATGVISGTPTALSGAVDYTVTASNFLGAGQTQISIEIIELFCGDSIISAPEQCDDGNLAIGDGCASACTLEFGWSCTGAPSVCTLDATLSKLTLGGAGGCLITTDGELGCFGFNGNGEVGDGSIDVEVHVPSRVSGLGVVETAAMGQQHSCAVESGGTLWCWGGNIDQQLGPNGVQAVDSPLPIQVTGLLPVTALDSGSAHVCVIDNNATVWCWGDNDNRQLGRGGTDTTDSPTPTQVTLPDGLTATRLGLGMDHSCAVLADQTVACWGDDDNGQLGDGAAGPDNGVATRVPGLSGIAEVKAGRDSTCARSALGQVSCWGDNADGQLGINSVVDNPQPQPVSLPSAATQIALGEDFACALLDDDSLWCWGEGEDFQLGSREIVDELGPSQLTSVPVVSGWRALEAGLRHVCAISDDDDRYCWGFSEDGQQGIAPRHQIYPEPMAYSSPPSKIVLSRPEYRGIQCGILADQTVECSGDSTVVSSAPTVGALGLFDPIHYHLSLPTPLAHFVGGGVLDMQIGDSFACVRRATDVQCWGDNSQLQLGQGVASTTDILVPVPVTTLAAVNELAVGGQHACARTGGSVQCWGDNVALQTGEGSGIADQSTPVTVQALNDAISVVAGGTHNCALRAGGVVSCWGNDAAGQLGDNDANPADSAVPVDVTGLPPGVTQIAAGQSHTCALAGGQVWCWGENSWGNLGQGTQSDSDTALLVPGLTGIVKIASGYNFVCALDAAGSMWCWGYAIDGQLGDGSMDITGLDRQLSPVRFETSGATPIEDVVAGNSMSCVKLAGEWRCVGFRSSGQLGNGTTLEPVSPEPMQFGL